MKIKLFATDLDGTLLDSNDKISQKNIAAIKEAVNAGTIVTFATGRMYSSAVQYARQTGIDVPLITYNGALIKSTSGKVYSEQYINPLAVQEFVAYCEHKQWYLQVNSNDALFFPVYLERSADYERSTGIKGETVGWQELGRKNENVAKMLLVTAEYGKQDVEEKIQEENSMIYELTQKFAGKVMLVKSKRGLIEVINPAVSKANALYILAKQFGFGIDEVMAIGDANNDLPMLEAAGKSVAMGNAADNIKSVCDYLVGTNDNDGVAEAIYKYILK
ncbi:Cof-type HAD-IIB family hydrolase [Pectinatus haikarae]|uniref:Cof subfamily protein (Haloacid dehalogenase superfamily) n=1 Tax=Pectinatus haikarae TaxID=349096 RepID=A0ABT9Y4Y0_9FIRM|nr:Cof-type HAD-IIB family hydrolase [Pectinatus haikarae]MDQ0202693.1 Cof subfamily protein (haloacid dehalogenase superfamily) [Pectinatus haikarae]